MHLLSARVWNTQLLLVERLSLEWKTVIKHSHKPQHVLKLGQAFAS